MDKLTDKEKIDLIDFASENGGWATVLDGFPSLRFYDETGHCTEIVVPIPEIREVDFTLRGLLEVTCKSLTGH